MTPVRNPEGSAAERARAAVEELRHRGTPEMRANLEPRYGIAAPNAFGTPMAEIKRIARTLGKDHELALALWATRSYEARLLASLVDEPGQVTPSQMDGWRAEFDNWAVVDTVCFNLFDRTEHALAKVDEWAGLQEEFDRRAAFVLLACVALHRKDVPPAALVERLPLLESGADDPRNFVKKGVSWALRAIAGRGAEARQAVVAVAERLASREDGSSRWVAKDVLRKLKVAPGNQ